MSMEQPYFDENFAPLFAGEGFGGLLQLLPIAFRQMAGYPAQYPGVIPEAGNYNYADNYQAMILTSMNAASLSKAKELDAQSQEAMLSLMTKRLFESFGGKLTPEQFGTIRQVAGWVGQYGPSVLGIARQVLQQGGLEDESGQQIDGILSTIGNVLDVTYGPSGSRMPFYSSVRKGIYNTVPLAQQDALLQASMRSMFPLQGNPQEMGGYNAAQMSKIYEYMAKRGHNVYNTESTEVKNLVQEKARGGLNSLSSAAQARFFEAAKARELTNFLKSTTNVSAQEEYLKKNGGLTNNNAKYINMLNNISSLNSALSRASFIKPNQDISAINEDVNSLTLEKAKDSQKEDLTAVGFTSEQADKILDKKSTIDETEFENMRSEASTTGFATIIARDIAAEQSNLARSLAGLREELTTAKEENDKDRIKSLNKQIAENEAQQKHNKYLAKQVENFKQTRLKADQSTRTLTAQKYRNEVASLQQEAFKEQIKKEAPTIEDKDLDALTETHMAKDYLQRAKIDTELLDVNIADRDTSKELIERRNKYLDAILNNKDVTDAVKERVRLLYTDTETGQTTAKAQYDKQIDEIIKKKVSKENINDLILRYGAILDSRDEKQRRIFEQQHPEILEFKAQIVADKGSDELKQEGRNVSRMQGALSATGGGSIAGRAIQTEQQVQQAMDMITQMSGKEMFTGDELEDYWSNIAYTMTQSRTNFNELAQISGIAARGAARFGGDRATASMAAAQSGLAARQVALQENLNPEKAGLVSAQAVGAASNNQLTRVINGLTHQLSGEDIDKKYKLLSPKRKALLKKLQNGNSLTNEELEDLSVNAFEIMNEMGLGGERQRKLLALDVEGSKGIYAMRQGARAEMDSITAKVIRRNIIGDELKSIKDNKDRDKVSDLVYKLFVTDSTLSRDDTGEKLKKKLIEEAEAAGIKGEALETIKAMDAKDLYLSASESFSETSRIVHNNNKDAARAAFIMYNKLENQEDLNVLESAIKSGLPFVQPSGLTAAMEALRDPNSNASDIMKAFLSQDFSTKDRKDQISKQLALLSMATGNFTLAGDNIDLDKAYKASKALTSVFKNTNQDKKVLQEIGSTAELLEKNKIDFDTAKGMSVEALKAKKFNDTQIKLIKESKISKDQFNAMATTLNVLQDSALNYINQSLSQVGQQSEDLVPQDAAPRQKPEQNKEGGENKSPKQPKDENKGKETSSQEEKDTTSVEMKEEVFVSEPVAGSTEDMPVVSSSSTSTDTATPSSSTSTYKENSTEQTTGNQMTVEEKLGTSQNPMYVTIVPAKDDPKATTDGGSVE